MEVKLKLDVSARQFFDYIEDSLLNDIETHTGKKVPITKISRGYRYNKKSVQRGGKGEGITVRISQFKPPLDYQATFSTEIDRVTITYHFEELGEEECEVTYSEVRTTKKKDHFTKLKEINTKRKATKMIKDVEKYILRYRLDDSEKEDAEDDE